MSFYKQLDDAIGKVIGTDLVLCRAGKDDKSRTLVEIQCTFCGEHRIVPWHRLNAGRPKRCRCKLSLSETVGIGSIIGSDKIIGYSLLSNRVAFEVQCLDCGCTRIIPKSTVSNDRYKCNCHKSSFDYTARYRHLVGQHDDSFNFDILDVCTASSDVLSTSSDPHVRLVVKCGYCDRLFSVRADSYLNGDFYLVKWCVCRDKSQLQNSYPVEEANKIIKEKYASLVGSYSGLLRVNSVGLYDNKVSVACRCSCGNTKDIILTLTQFNSKRILSCGCASTSFGEKIISDLLKSLHLSYKREFTFNNLVSPRGYKLRYDFCIQKSDKTLYLIEYNGRQHYDERSFNYGYVDGDNFEYRCICDNIKVNYAKSNNIPLLIIKYTSDSQVIKDEVLKFLRLYKIV